MSGSLHNPGVYERTGIDRLPSMEQYYRLATTFDEYDIYYGLYTMGYLVGTDRKDNLRFLLPKEIYTLIHSGLGQRGENLGNEGNRRAILEWWNKITPNESTPQTLTTEKQGHVADVLRMQQDRPHSGVHHNASSSLKEHIASQRERLSQQNTGTTGVDPDYLDMTAGYTYDQNGPLPPLPQTFTVDTVRYFFQCIGIIEPTEKFTDLLKILPGWMEDGLICLYEESGRPELDAVFLNQIQQWHEENGVNTTLNRKLEGIVIDSPGPRKYSRYEINPNIWDLSRSQKGNRTKLDASEKTIIHNYEQHLQERERNENTLQELPQILQSITEKRRQLGEPDFSFSIMMDRLGNEIREAQAAVTLVQVLRGIIGNRSIGTYVELDEFIKHLSLAEKQTIGTVLDPFGIERDIGSTQSGSDYVIMLAIEVMKDVKLSLK